MASANPFASLYGNIFGPLYFATVLSTGLDEAGASGRFFYIVHYPNDSLRLKSFVGAVWVFETIHTALLISGVYKYIIATLVNPLAIAQEIPELTATVSMPTQGFFIYRIYIFGGRNIVGPILWGIQMIFQIGEPLEAFGKPSLTGFSLNLSGCFPRIQAISLIVIEDSFFTDITVSCISIAAAVDVLIAIAMTYLLYKTRAIAGFEGSAHILQRLTVFAVNTGIWTATFAVLSVVLVRALPESNLLYLVFAIPLASLYCNMLLANLNARMYIRGMHEVVMSGTVSSGTRTETQSNAIKVLPPIPLVSFRAPITG
ncbi:hypothetical protein JVT61DRAFT_4937 [Boletus reticuloceps]|uniref:DUF6534 domain-containing protein n=1 Tax=Boletus reticuloceps TaxID=495285 RepID=A0A8I2YW60_9AGAM|nr:hypothetical protein JVT61DRAFT_4937 [Boletus reticuloceps]